MITFGRPAGRRCKHYMKSTPYYVPYSPKYTCSGSANGSRPNSYEIALPQDLFLPQTLSSDPLEAFVQGKLRILEAAIAQVLKEIEQRELLRDVMLDAIDNQMCELTTSLMAVAPWGDSPSTVGDPRRRAALEKEISALDAEKRHETTATWKDIANLKKELRELLREYHEEKRKGLIRE